MPSSRKKSPPPEPEIERIDLPSDRLRDLTAAETFRVWHCPSNPHSVGEYVVTVSPDGIRVWESHEWPDGHEGHSLDWFEVDEIGGRAIETMRGLELDTKEIIEELETWTSIRNGEAHRVLRAREIERTQNMRRILHDVGKVLDGWMPPGRRRITWRDMVRRRRSGSDLAT